MARLANFIFRIGNFTSIKYIILETSMEIITFYIVPINTPLLLCLANIDKLRVAFNNSINQII